LPVEAQQPAKNIPRIGVLRSVTLTPAAQLIGEAFLQGLRELGWTEGENIGIEYRYAEGKVERLPDLAAELVGLIGQRKRILGLVEKAGSRQSM